MKKKFAALILVLSAVGAYAPAGIDSSATIRRSSCFGPRRGRSRFSFSRRHSSRAVMMEMRCRSGVAFGAALAWALPPIQSAAVVYDSTGRAGLTKPRWRSRGQKRTTSTGTGARAYCDRRQLLARSVSARRRVMGFVRLGQPSSPSRLAPYPRRGTSFRGARRDPRGAS